MTPRVARWNRKYPVVEILEYGPNERVTALIWIGGAIRRCHVSKRSIRLI